MRNEFRAVGERAGRWHIAYCPEIPGANGQGRTKAVALKSLANAIALIRQDRRRDGSARSSCIGEAREGRRPGPPERGRAGRARESNGEPAGGRRTVAG